MRKIKEKPAQSSIVMLSLKHFPIGSLGYYNLETDIWWIWAVDFSNFFSQRFQDRPDEAPHAWRPVEDNLLRGWEYLGKGTTGLKGTFDPILDAVDKTFKARNAAAFRGHGVLSGYGIVTAQVGEQGTRKWADAVRRSDHRNDQDAKIVRIRVLR